MGLNVVVNISSVSPPLAGIGRYSRCLLGELLTSKCIDNIEGITPFRTLNRESIRQQIQICDRFSNGQSPQSMMSSIKKTIASTLQESLTVYEIRRAVEHISIKLRPHEYEGSVYWDPGFLKLPLSLPSLTTVYDLSHLVYPECHPKARVQFLDKRLEQSIDRSDRIVTISEFSKEEIVKKFGIDRKKIFIVPPAVSNHFRREPELVELFSLRQRYQLPEQFILSICTLEPRKNLVSLVNAFKLLPTAMRKAYPLVLVGARGWGNDKLDALLIKLEQNGEVIRIGYVTQQDLPLFYRAAKMLVYVSLYEGYGMPIAEAMASGTAVITSNVSSMPEVANGSCLLVEPLDENMICEAIQGLVEDNKLRNFNIHLGLEKSEEYTWEKSSIKLIKAMDSLC